MQSTTKILTGFYKLTKLVVTNLPILSSIGDSTTWKVFRHRVAESIDPRTNSTFTGFYRLPTQFDALTGPVMARFKSDDNVSPLRIVVMGCSNGAEVYTISSQLLERCPGVEFEIDAYDINADMCTKAKSADYAADEVLNNKVLPPEFIHTTFDMHDGRYRVKAHIADRAHFYQADVLSPDLREKIGACDILFAQNFLFHLDRKSAARAFDNLCALLNERGVFFVDGMDLGLREKCSRRQSLRPLEYRIENIHNEARRARASGWPYRYWGLEPFMTVAESWQRRYATVFTKS